MAFIGSKWLFRVKLYLDSLNLKLSAPIERLFMKLSRDEKEIIIAKPLGFSTPSVFKTYNREHQPRNMTAIVPPINF
ncbi:hypothetical protein EAW55_09710 [Legionella jordanis]|nr:hypothetical protein EAW55_09710 [Legionella jordanis]